MFEVEIVSHKNITKKLLGDICNIKSTFGSYSRASQVQWMENNLEEEDLHFIVSNNDRMIAYANIIRTNLECDDNKIIVLGVGNVCVKERSLGLGKSLMHEVNSYIKKQRMPGLLLCKKDLVSFYEKCGWVESKLEDVSSYSLLFNFEKINSKLKYSGRNF